MNKLILKTTRDMVNEPIVVHIMKYDNSVNKLVNICGYEFTSVTSNDKIVELDLGQDFKAKTGEDNVVKIPYGAIARIECPKGSEPVFIEDMLSLSPTKNAAIYAREFPDEVSNIESVVKTNDGFKVTLKEAEPGTLELYEVSDKANPTRVLQRLTLPTSAGSTIYTFTPTTPINAASNVVSVRWSISDHSKHAGVNISSVDVSTAPHIEITGLSLNNGVLEASINNMDSNRPFKATEADVTFTDSSNKTMVLRGTVENTPISGKGKITFTPSTSSKLNNLENIGTASVTLIGDDSNKVNYSYNITPFKSNSNGIKANYNDMTFNDAGNKLTMLIKDEKNVPDSTLSLSSLTNEYVAGKLLHNPPVITKKSISGNKYWEVVIDNIRTIPMNRLYNTRMDLSYNEPNKLSQNIVVENVKVSSDPGIVPSPGPSPTPGPTPGTTEPEVKSMTNTVAYFNDETGNLEITMRGPYDIQADQSYKIRDIVLVRDDREVYVHPSVETITGTNDIRIRTNYSSSYGPIDTVSFRYSFANKVWSPVQDIDCPDIFNEYIDRIANKIKASDYTINENNLIISNGTTFIPIPYSVIVKKTILNNSTNTESSNINIKNRTALFKLGVLNSSGSEEEDLNGFTLNFTYNYYDKTIEITKEYRQLVETLDVDKVKTVKWNILSPYDVWGDWIEPFDNPSNPDNNGIKQYANILKPIYEKDIDAEHLISSSDNIRYVIKHPSALALNEIYNVFPMLHMVDRFPLTDNITNICWCAKLKLSQSNDGYMFRNDIHDIRLKCKFMLNDEEKVVYVKFKSVKKLIDTVECIDPYLVNDAGQPISMADFDIYADVIMNGMPFVTKNKERVKTAIKSIYSHFISDAGTNKYLVTHPSSLNVDYFDFKYSRWGEHKQIFPFTLIIGDIVNLNLADIYNLDTHDGFDTAYKYIKNNSTFTLPTSKVGITVTPEITFKNRQVISLPEQVFKTNNGTKYMKLNKVLSEVGITATNIVTPMFNDVINEQDQSRTEITAYNAAFLPAMSNFAFKFSPDFKKLHFNQGVEYKLMSPLLHPYKKVEDRYRDFTESNNITHIKINYIGKANVGNKNIINLTPDKIKNLNMFTVNSINSSSTVPNPSITGIDTASNIANGNRTKDMPVFLDPYFGLLNTRYPNRTSINSNFPVIETAKVKTSTPFTVEKGVDETYQTGKYNYNIYKYPKIMEIHNKMNKNINNFYYIDKGIPFIYPSSSSDSKYYPVLAKDYDIYNNYSTIKCLVDQTYNSPNLLAKPVVLKASKGTDDNMLSEYQKVFYKQVPHYIFTTSGNIDDASNKEIFNFRELKNDNHDYVIKYQVKFEDEDDYNENELVYYLPSIAIENSLLDTYNKFTLNDIKTIEPEINKTNAFDIIKTLENKELVTLTDNNKSFWNKDIESVNLKPYITSNIFINDRNSSASRYILDTNVLLHSYIRTLAVFHDEFEAIYTDKTKSPFDVAREYLNTHEDHDPFLIDYRNSTYLDIHTSSTDTETRKPEMLQFNRVIVNELTSKNTWDTQLYIDDVDKLIFFNTFKEPMNIASDTELAYGKLRYLSNSFPVIFSSGISDLDVTVDETKKVKIYAEFVIPPSRTYPSITTNKTLFEHNIIKLESQVVNLSELKNYGNDVNLASLIRLGSNGRDLVASVDKVTGLDATRDFLYNKLVPNESDRFYNRLSPSSILLSLNHSKIKVKEIPGMEYQPSEIETHDGIETYEFQPNQVVVPNYSSKENMDYPFISDIGHNGKAATLILESEGFSKEIPVNQEYAVADPSMLTSNDKVFIMQYACMSIESDEQSNLDINFQRKTYVAESSAKPDWIKLNLHVIGTTFPIMFSKVLSTEENKKYPKTSIYKYKMQLDPEWFDRLKSEVGLEKIKELLFREVNRTVNDPQTYIEMTIDFEFSYNGVNTFTSYQPNSLHSQLGMMIEVQQIHKINPTCIPLFRTIRDKIQSSN